MSCGVGRRCGSDLVLLWLWCRPAAAAPTSPLAWELPHTAGAALTSQKKKKKRMLGCVSPFGVHRVISYVHATDQVLFFKDTAQL